MREYKRLIQSEMYKMRHTLLMPLHLIIPVLGIVVFTAYFTGTNYRSEEVWLLYMEALSIALPFVISIVCAMSVSLEEQNHFFVFYGTTRSKFSGLLAKWSVLVFLCLGALTLAVGGFALSQMMILGQKIVIWEIYIGTGLILWLCSLSLYLFHIFASIRWGRNISICMGTAGSLLAAVLQTQLGDGIWQFIVCEFGSRWGRMVLLQRLGLSEALKGVNMTEDLLINIGVTILLSIILLFWFYRYESRRIYD